MPNTRYKVNVRLVQRYKRALGINETNLDNQIDAAVVFSAQHEIDAEDEYQRNHRPRRRPRRFDERPETTATLTFKNFYRK